MPLKDKIYLFLEKIVPSMKLDRLKEENDLNTIYNNAIIEMNSQNSFMRTSIFNNTIKRIDAYKTKSFINKNLASRQIKQLQDLKKQKNDIFKESNFKFVSQLFRDQNGKSSLNEEQIEAVIADEDCNLIIAGAGSGKTTVIAHKVKYLVEKGISPDDILLLSFTKAYIVESPYIFKTKNLK